MRMVAVAAVAALVGSLVLPAAAAERREPPACAAIAFRPIAPGAGDGVQDAGLYMSRFGRIELKANVKGGVATGYFLDINGKPLKPVAARDLPRSAAACAKVKRLSAPAKPLDPCDGDRLTVLITHADGKRYFVLYGRTRKVWHYCSAGAA